MTKSIYISMLSLALILLSSCSGEEPKNPESNEQTVSEEMVDKLNEVQDINDESTQLNDELDSLLLILEE